MAGISQVVTGHPTIRIGAGTGDGSSAGNAGSSALAIKQRTGTTTDGLYWVKPPNGAATQVWCDMNTDGGGWMLVARTHPSANPAPGNWGWRSPTVFGAPTTYGAGYCMDSLNWYNNGFRFHEYIFGNQSTDNSNAWGPFIYKTSVSNATTFMTSDTQQTGTYATLKSNLSIYGTTIFPGMQSVFGYPVSATAANVFFMRDCCTPESAYGVQPTGMLTTYCSVDTPVVWYSGPWCNGATLSGNNWVHGGSSSPLNTGGTNQAMIMVR